MRIALACDHAGIAHKQAIAKKLEALGHQVDDFGTDTSQACDYADFAIPAAEAVANGLNARAVLVCGTGIGMCMAANKVPGIRCALAHSVETATITAAHNNPQVLAIGARIVDTNTAVLMVEAWLKTPFEARHQGRIDKIATYERKRSGNTGMYRAQALDRR